MMENETCVLGCKHFTGGEIKHHKDCPHYRESLSKMYDDLNENWLIHSEVRVQDVKDLKRMRSIIFILLVTLLMAVITLWTTFDTRYDLGYKEGQSDCIETIKQ